MNMSKQDVVRVFSFFPETRQEAIVECDRLSKKYLLSSGGYGIGAAMIRSDFHRIKANFLEKITDEQYMALA